MYLWAMFWYLGRQRNQGAKAEIAQEKMYTKHGAFKVHFAGHDVNSNILVACYQVVLIFLIIR